MHVLMTMAMVQVGIMWMPMHQRLMTVPVRMHLTERHVRPMYMLMMRVVAVAMLVFYRLVNVLMVVPLGEMQPQSSPHQAPGNNERDRWLFVQEKNGEHRTDKGRQREIGPRPRRAEVS